MNRNKRACLFIFCLVILVLSFGQQAFAGGAYLSEVATPASLGTVGVGNVVNNIGADSAWANPAGMTGLDKDTVLGGLQVVIPNIRWDSDIATAGGKDGGNAGNFAAIPGLFAVKTLGDKWRIGFGASAPFGGGLDYGDDFVGRYQAQKSIIAGLGLSPSVAYKINDQFSVGAGVSVTYTKYDLEVAIKQPGFGDGQVTLDGIDDWSYQGFAGLTWQVTERAMIGAVYRSKNDIELEGDIDFDGIVIPILNELTSRFDEAEVDFDFPEVYRIGLKYQATDRLVVMVDADLETWSDFSETGIEISTSGPVTKVAELDRNYKDTWHVGAALAYKIDSSSGFATGVSYDSSPVDDNDRTADLPLDEQLKFGMAYVKEGKGKLGYGIGFSLMWFGDGKMDQVAQGELFKGEFESNYVIFAGGSARYEF